MSLAEPPLFTALRDARSILIAGAGGGFDVYAGLPGTHAVGMRIEAFRDEVAPRPPRPFPH